MTKALFVDPKALREKGEVTFTTIPLNHYVKLDPRDVRMAPHDLHSCPRIVGHCGICPCQSVEQDAFPDVGHSDDS
jgi:hypothetical protein